MSMRGTRRGFSPTIGLSKPVQSFSLPVFFMLANCPNAENHGAICGKMQEKIDRSAATSLVRTQVALQ